MTQRHYSKAPIVEAIVDIQVKMAEGFSHETFNALHSKLNQRFPTKSSIQEVEMGMATDAQPGGELQFSSSKKDLGLKLISKDNSRVLQVRENGYTYSHLPPYTSWEELRSEAYEAWRVFVDLCKPKTVVRCALRFINRIEIPKPSIELHDYFYLYPKIPNGIPQDVSGMFMQLQMPQKDLDGTAILNQAIAEPTSPGTISVLLDFDLFQKREYEPEDDSIWLYLDKLRDRKNELFEACITNETRSLIE